jgi:hypothetical protein
LSGFFLHFQFPEETGNIQSAFSGNSKLVIIANESLIEVDYLILELAVNKAFSFRRRLFGFDSFFRKLAKN